MCPVIMRQVNAEWVDAPLVLIGLRTCNKEDIRVSTAELLYGKALRILLRIKRILRLWRHAQRSVAVHRSFSKAYAASQVNARCHRRNRPFMFRDSTCTHVFLRDDSAKRSLEQPYTDPHRVVKRIWNHIFAVEVDGKRLNISVEHLKLAYITAQ